MSFIKFLKPAFKFILPYLVNWLVKKAEEEITEAKKGTDKKAKVIKEIEDFAEKTGFSGMINYNKLSVLIDDKVQKVINKI